jgi:gliding motility-associated-like protein
MRWILCFFILSVQLVLGQNTWKISYERPKCFIENQGQFDGYQNQQTGPIKFAADFGKAKVFFGERGMKYFFMDADKISHKDGDSFKNTKEVKMLKDHKQWERTIGKYRYQYDEINASFLASNPTSIEGINPQQAYFSYTFKSSDGTYHNKNEIRGYEQIVYTNIVPGIDLKYSIHPSSGLKYALTVHPNADPSSFQLLFDRDLALVNQELTVETMFGTWVDHAPISFYEWADNAAIPSSFKLLNERTMAFSVGEYDASQTLIIDPWTQLPSFSSNWDCVWECDKDAAGNIYAIGGVMPLQLLKYNSAGNLQWTYNTPYDTSNVWLGTLAVDNLGNSYVTAGSVAAIQKINTSGTLVWDNPNPGGFLSNDEFWSISFNCDQSKLVVGGTGGSAFTLTASIYDIDVNTGNVTASQDVAQGSTFGIPPSVQEVRAICASPNGKYYFMTQDTVGAINQNLNACGGNPLFYKIDNSYDLGYKCENYRYDNAGICAIKANNAFYYTQNGTNVAKRSLQTGAIVTTSPIPGGANTSVLGDFSVANSGLDLDNCGNVYVGSSTGVVKYDANLVQLATYPTNFKVYDVHVLNGGDIVAVGSTGTSSSNVRTGYVQTFAAAACAPLATNCCDASICPVQNVCITDAPFQLTAATPGGTWSGPGVSAAGVFTPANAGVGNQTITYTLACGSETVSIVVSPCQGLTACVEANGSITVSGGVAPYTWAYYQAAQNTPITNQTECQNCGYTWFFGQCLNGLTPVNSCNSPAQWVNFANGNNAVAPNGAAQVQVTDAGGTVQVFTLANLAPCNPNPCPSITLTPSNIVNATCFGLTDGSANVSASGGTAPYTYQWMPGNLSGASQSGLAAGTYTVTVTDANLCTGDTTLVITSPAQIQVNTLNVTGTDCGSSSGAIEISVSGGSGNYSYAWNPNAGSSASIQNLAGGNYSVVVTDLANGCTSTLQINVPTLGGPVLNNPVLTPALCFGASNGSIQASAGGSTPPYQYSLNNGPSQASGLFSGLAAGQYTITATDANGCQNSLNVTVVEPSLLTLNPMADVQICSGDSVQLTASASGGTAPYAYAWMGSAGTSSYWAAPLVSSSVDITVTDANGCTAGDLVTVDIIPCGNIEIFIPNVFTPNGDGQNDTYGIQSINALTQEAVIVNRWGEVMAVLNQLNQLWDGTTANGNEALEGVYFMKYRLTGLGSDEQQGHVFFHLKR